MGVVAIILIEEHDFAEDDYPIAHVKVKMHNLAGKSHIYIDAIPTYEETQWYTYDYWSIHRHVL